MKYIVQLNDMNIIDPLIERRIDAVTIGTEFYSSGGVLKCSLADIETIIQRINGRMDVYIMMNQLFHQHLIPSLKEYLLQLAKLPVTGLLFQDFGVLNMVQEMALPFKMIYAPDTLNTNHQTLNTLNQLGVDMFFLSGQLHKDEVDAIIEKTKAPCILPIHGVQYVAYSRRKLLTNYFNQIHQSIPVNYEENLVIKVNNKEEYSNIFEDHSGTHIYTVNELCTLDMEFPEAYGYIETLYLENDYLFAVIDAYQNKMSYDSFIQHYPDHHYDRGFLEDGTVYKIEDVRKREENEKG